MKLLFIIVLAFVLLLAGCRENSYMIIIEEEGFVFFMFFVEVYFSGIVIDWSG